MLHSLALHLFYSARIFLGVAFLDVLAVLLGPRSRIYPQAQLVSQRSRALLPALRCQMAFSVERARRIQLGRPLPLRAVVIEAVVDWQTLP